MRCGRSVADPPDDPVVVEAAGEVAEHLVELLDGAESVQPEQLLLQGPDESLDAAIAFGLPQEGRARLDAEGLELVVEGVRDELASMVVAEPRALRDLVLVPPLREVSRLAQALAGLEPRAASRGAHPEALDRALVDDHEDRGVSLAGEAASRVDGPHLVGRLGRDRAVVGAWPAHAGRTVAGEDAVLAHDPEDPAHRGADTVPDSGHRAGYDGVKRRKGSKVHISVDTLGHLLALHVTPADKQDRTQVRRTAKAVQRATGRNVELAYVDQGYSGEQAEDDDADHGIMLHVVKLPQAKRGFVLLPRRWVVGRSFAWMTRFRRPAKDYERLLKTLAELHLVEFACLMLARHLAVSA